MQRTLSETADNGMRFSASLSAGLCSGIENSSYQPKPGGLDRLERKI